MLRKIIRILWRDRDGSALVEGAVLVPMLFTLLLGVYEFSWFFYQQHLISTGLHDAAHFLARSSDPTNATIQGYAKNLATNAAITGGTARVAGWTTGNVTITFANNTNTAASSPCGTTPCRGLPVIQVVSVSTSFVDPSFGFFSFLGLTAPTISVSHSERVIGLG